MATSNPTAAVLARLHTGLRERRSPQQVAADLIELGADQWLPDEAADKLRELGRYAVAWHAVGSSMPDTWRSHPGLARAYAAAQTALTAVVTTAGRAAIPPADPADPAALATWTATALTVLGLPTDEPAPARHGADSRTVTSDSYGYSFTYRRRPRGRRGDKGGHANAHARMDAATRRVELPGVSVRTYRRAVRAVLHLQQRTVVFAAERDRESATAFGKGRLAHTISREAFGACERTAAFVAYYTARLGMRTLFLAGSQERPMDTIAEALLGVALDAPTSRPDVIARVLTRQKVLARLSDAERGELLGVYYEQLAACSRALRGSFDPNRDRTQMVVRRGDDSSTWNAASRAFNQARTGWLNLATALGLAHVVEASCPGKVPALIASDVAYWHTVSGSDQHADIAVWAELPLPWDVVLDRVACPATVVRTACGKHNVDPDTTGWTQPYRQAALEQPTAAPDLVHGVVVASPLLAGILRDAGVFSGQAPTRRQARLLGGLFADVLAEQNPTR